MSPGAKELRWLRGLSWCGLQEDRCHLIFPEKQKLKSLGQKFDY